MKKISLALAMVGAAVVANQAHAVDVGARFGGSVAHSCTLTAGADGVMVPNIDNDVLSSTASGGSAATVTALTTARGYRLSAIAPAAFNSAPAGESGTYSFVSTYSVSGPTSATNVPGATTTSLNRGSNAVSVDLVATKTDGNVYSNGSYEAIVTVRCE
jgi:hypothetical protein